MLAFLTAAAQFIFTQKKPIQTLKDTIEKHEGIKLTDSVPFSAIRIIDTRYDTTNIGFYLDGFLAFAGFKSAGCCTLLINIIIHCLVLAKTH